MVHDGIQPNPLDVVLMAQNLSCRYQDAFIKEETQHFKKQNCSTTQSLAGGNWQIIIKLASARRRKKYGTAYAFEAKSRYGEIVFRGIRSCAATSMADALQEALVEASITARSLGFRQILLLSYCKKLVQVCNGWRIPDWKERTMMVDISHLQQMGLVSKLNFVPKVVLANFWQLVVMATKMPPQYCWPSMDHVVS